jgi:putative nucleotidyltransferase with HDIG domain
MRNVAVNLLKPGLVFSEAVYIDESNVFIPAGVPVRQKDIDKLIELRVETVLTEGVPALAEEEEPLETTESPLVSPTPEGQKAGSVFSVAEVQENKGAYRIYISLVERLYMVFHRISGSVDKAADNRTINEISVSLFQVVQNQRERFVGFILGGEVKGMELAKSSINTAILSSLTAQELKFPHHKVLHVMTGALLHDIGMLRLPKEIIQKRGGLSDAENKQMQSHPQIAYQIAVKELSYPDEVGKAVLQHHERWDGGGYPKRIAGEAIDTGAQVVSVADAFEAMVSLKPYRSPMVGYQAMKNLLADNSRRFNPQVLKAFLMTMGIHPIGSIVQLNNGAVARVVESRPNAPLRPRIQILMDGSKKTTSGKVFVDLLTEKSLYITKALESKEISDLNA